MLKEHNVTVPCLLLRNSITVCYRPVTPNISTFQSVCVCVCIGVGGVDEEGLPSLRCCVVCLLRPASLTHQNPPPAAPHWTGAIKKIK